MNKTCLFEAFGNCFEGHPRNIKNNRSGNLLAEKESTSWFTVTSTAKGDTITVIGVCSAEATFLKLLSYEGWK